LTIVLSQCTVILAATVETVGRFRSLGFSDVFLRALIALLFVPGNAGTQECMSCPQTNCNTLTECDFGGVPRDYCKYSNNGCPDNYLPAQECCCWNSPVIVDVDGKGFDLTDPEHGVLFDITGSGRLVRVAWPAPGSTHAWLALDRNGNGRIDNATELFGNLTQQPVPPAGTKKNGFLALAVFDTLEKGGNGDGVIDLGDAVYLRLRLWQDLNHNGISEPGELKTLSELGISRIDLDYREAHRIGEFGNHFVFRAKVYNWAGAHTGRWAWDVVIRTLPLGSGQTTTLQAAPKDRVSPRFSRRP
jgi:hypothetical protein